MLSQRVSLIVPLVMIAIGSGALLTTLGVAPQIDWVWTIGMGMAGLALLIAVGFDKVTFVASAMFFSVCILSVLRQLKYLEMSAEIPLLVIICGFLLLVSRSPWIPSPSWIEPAKSVD